MTQSNQDDRNCSQHERDNHSDQMNPNNDAYWSSRGYEDRPEDWEGRVAERSGKVTRSRTN